MATIDHIAITRPAAIPPDNPTRSARTIGASPAHAADADAPSAHPARLAADRHAVNDCIREKRTDGLPDTRNSQHIPPVPRSADSSRTYRVRPAAELVLANLQAAAGW